MITNGTGQVLSERDTLREDGSIDWRVVRTIAMVRTDAEHDLDVCVAAYGPCLRIPAGIGFHNINEWRKERARVARADNPTLSVTPILKLYRQELRNVWRVARSLQENRRELMAALRASAALVDGRAA